MDVLTVPIFSQYWVIAVVLNITFIVSILILGRLFPMGWRAKFGECIGFVLVFILFYHQIYFNYRGLWTIRVLPLEYCSLMAMSAVIALYTRSPGFYELTLFLGIIPPLQALIVPAIYQGEDRVIFYLFFLSHSLSILAPLYLTFVLGMRPRIYSWYKSTLPFSFVVPVLICMNKVLQTNYMFLLEKPMVTHPMNFGSWPFYIFFWAGLLLMFSFLISCCLRKQPR